MIGPVVYLQLAESDWSANDLKWIEKGSMEWRRLGFDVRPLGEAIDPELRRLPDSARDSSPDMSAAIVIRIHLDESLGDRFYGLSSTTTRDIRINPILTSDDPDARLYELYGTIAHELGHHLLDVQHMPAGKQGLMASPRTSWHLQEDDLEFAYEATGREALY